MNKVKVYTMSEWSNGTCRLKTNKVKVYTKNEQTWTYHATTMYFFTHALKEHRLMLNTSAAGTWRKKQFISSESRLKIPAFTVLTRA